jgi:hypothetical protein
MRGGSEVERLVQEKPGDASRSAHQTGRDPIPIAFSPAQFNEFYRQCSRRLSGANQSLRVSTPDRILFNIVS